MNALAFIVIAVMISTYIVRDGYDLGVGTISLLVARNGEERAAAMASIGPFWNGNEVWLIAAGGALFALFPQAYASAFSAFYLPFIVVLWLLMIRGMALELRNHLASELWRNFFDACFAVASGLLIILFGVALGDLLRGVPLDRHYYFLGTFAFLLNPYAIGVGVFALVALALHGASFLALRSDGELRQRAKRLIGILWPAVFVVYVGLTIATVLVHSPLPNFSAMPVLYAIPIISLAGLLGVPFALRAGRLHRVFDCSTLFVGGSMASAAATLYPYLLSGFPSTASGLTIFQQTPSAAALAVTCAILIAGLVAVSIYQFLVGRRLGQSL